MDNNSTIGRTAKLIVLLIRADAKKVCTKEYLVNLLKVHPETLKKTLKVLRDNSFNIENSGYPDYTYYIKKLPIIESQNFIIRFNTTLNDGICEISESGEDDGFEDSHLSANDFEEYFQPKKLHVEEWDSLSEDADDYEYWYFDMSHQEGVALVKKLTAKS